MPPDRSNKAHWGQKQNERRNRSGGALGNRDVIRSHPVRFSLIRDKIEAGVSSDLNASGYTLAIRWSGARQKNLPGGFGEPTRRTTEKQGKVYTFQFYVGDVYRRIEDMNTTEIGAYLLLLMYHWNHSGLPA